MSDDQLPASSPGGTDDIAGRLAKVEKDATDARHEAASWRVKFRELEKGSKERESAVLAEQGKWQEAYGTAEKRLKELEPLEEKVRAYDERMSAIVQRELEQLPDEYRTLLPRGLPLDEQLDFAAKLRALAAKSQAPQSPPKKIGGPPPVFHASPTQGPMSKDDFRRAYRSASQEERARIDEAMRAGRFSDLVQN